MRRIAEAVQLAGMRRRQLLRTRVLSFVMGALFVLGWPGCLSGEPTAAAIAAFNSYTARVEARLDGQHRSRSTFLGEASSSVQVDARLRRGELIVEELTSAGDAALPGAMLHDWRGTAFAPGAKAADFEQLMRQVSAYPRHFAPEVLQARTIAANGDRMQTWMRVRQRHVITVVMDTTYAVEFGRLDALHGYSVSKALQISEVEAPGTSAERRLSASEEHGFLWRLNTYWSYEERDGGLYLQVESVSLTRSIPEGLGWIVRPFVESVPRESLAFTLHATCEALRK